MKIYKSDSEFSTIRKNRILGISYALFYENKAIMSIGNFDYDYFVLNKIVKRETL